MVHQQVQSNPNSSHFARGLPKRECEWTKHRCAIHRSMNFKLHQRWTNWNWNQTRTCQQHHCKLLLRVVNVAQSTALPSRPFSMRQLTLVHCEHSGRKDPPIDAHLSLTPHGRDINDQQDTTHARVQVVTVFVLHQQLL